jgi:hypothetical protein
MASTTMFDTIDALVSLISGLPQVSGSAGVTVADGFPAGLATNVVVSVGGTTNPTVRMLSSQPVTLGDLQVEEVYEVEGTISAKAGGNSQKAVRDAAKTVYEAIDGAVRAAFLAGGNRLGVSGLEFAELSAGDLMQSAGHDNLTERAATLTFRVRCTGYV